MSLYRSHCYCGHGGHADTHCHGVTYLLCVQLMLAKVKEHEAGTLDDSHILLQLITMGRKMTELAAGGAVCGIIAGVITTVRPLARHPDPGCHIFEVTVLQPNRLCSIPHEGNIREPSHTHVAQYVLCGCCDAFHPTTGQAKHSLEASYRACRCRRLVDIVQLPKATSSLQAQQSV